MDFEYRGKLKHAVPNPYVWDETLATDYKQIDDEHTVLFENILAVSQHPEDPEVLAKLKTLLEQHFEYEEGKFCEIPSYNCIDHKMKHYKFFVTFKDLKVPIGCEEIHWAKNWLAQHIKNTDHSTKNDFCHPTSMHCSTMFYNITNLENKQFGLEKKKIWPQKKKKKKKKKK